MHVKKNFSLLALPASFWFAAFTVAPLSFVILYSFCLKTPYGGISVTFNFENFLRIFDPVYLAILINSFKFAATTTLLCLLLGFPTAYAMAMASPKMKSIFLIVIMLPFLSNFVVRAFAIKILLGVEGPISRFLVYAGFSQMPISFNNTPLAVWIGMITNYIPFMILPIFVNLERFDFALVEAGHDLGVKGLQVFLKIVLPLTKQGIFAGCILVFIPCLGEYIIPDLLGGAQIMLLGNLVTDQFLKARDWPFGSALAVVMILATLLLFSLERQFKTKRGEA